MCPTTLIWCSRSPVFRAIVPLFVLGLLVSGSHGAVVAQAAGPSSSEMPSSSEVPSDGVAPEGAASDVAASDGAATEISLAVEIRSPGAETTISIPVRLNDEMDVVALSAADLSSVLNRSVEVGTRRTLNAAGEDGWLSPQELRDAGMDVVFHATDLTVTITVPVEAMEVVPLNVYRSRSLPDYPPVPNARLAVGMPLVLEGEMLHASGDAAVGTAVFSAFPGVAFRSWVVESSPWLQIRDGEPNGEIRDTRVVRSRRSTGVRLQAGQIVPATRGLQAPEELLAASVDNLQAHSDRTVVPALFARPIIVDTPGTIDIVVNGRTARSVPVQPGRYDVREIPVSAGVNAVEVVYRRDDGTEERFDLVIPYAGTLIEPGTFRYSVTAGVEEERPSRPAGSGFLQYGFGPAFTGGLLADVASTAGQLGVEATTALNLGEPSGAAYVSLDAEATFGWAMRAGYRFSHLSRPRLPTVATALEYRSDTFVRPSTESGTTQQSWQLSTSLGQALPGEFGLVVGHVMRAYHDDTPSSSFLYGTLSRRLGEQFSARVSGFVDFYDPRDQWGASVAVVYQAAARSVTGTSVLDVRDASLDVSTSAIVDGPTALAGTAALQDVGLTDGTFGGASVSGRAAGSRAEAMARGSLSLSGDGSTERNEFRSLSYMGRLGTGVYYADGVFGVARPIRSGFALVRPDTMLPTDTVLVTRGRRGGRPIASGVLGAAVVGPLEGGSAESLSVDVPGIPADYSLRETEFLLHPEYRSGAAITIRSSQRLYVRGRLTTEDGAPVSYVGLAVEPAFEPEVAPDAPPVGGAAFVDEDGNFEIYDLLPGDYRVMLQDGSARRFTFSVPVTPGPLHQVGTIVVSADGMEEDAP